MVQPIKGRGAVSNPEGRFETLRREALDDGWGTIEEELPPLETTVYAEPGKTIITRNDSPDLSFVQSINPYKGCEHGCIYCYARPSHAYLNLSPGLDFETKIFYKPNAAELLDAELRRPSYKPSVIALGANTDPYQPVERRLLVTRSILEVLARFRHPVAIITKSTGIERDLDLVTDLARDRLISVGLSITTLDPQLKRSLEPRAAAPAARLRTMRRLADAGVPVRVMFSPVIPSVNDAELERVLEAGAEAGASSASYVLLRLPYELKDLFREWLQANLPLKAAHVMSLIQQSRGGKDYQPGFGLRMRGTGAFAELIAKRFALARRRYGLDRESRPANVAAFRVPPATGDQMGLF